ncbi:MAG TPA: tetratricopeptide repeat protein, partial [Candidatus Saccharimonadales bacterium]|nr:tetratricopeptide repeat protein [Candidatus Saccharimonadales bacterium]
LQLRRHAAARAQAPAPGGSMPPELELRGLMLRGKQALEIEEYQTARGIFERAVALAPSSPETHYLLARALAGLKQVKLAATEYRKTLDLKPGHAGSLLGLASIAEGTGDYDEAERDYKAAIAAGSRERAQRALASLLARIGRRDEAESILTGLLKANPSDADSRFELGLARALNGDCEGAIPELRRVVQAQPRRIPALFQLGNCLSRTGKKDEAAQVLEDFQKVSREEKERIDRERQVHFLLLAADNLAEAGNLDGAIAKAREATRTDPSSSRAQAFLGSLLSEAGRDPEALDALLEASRLEPGDAMTLTETGRLLVLAGRIPEAIDYLQRATKADVNLPAPHRFLAILYMQAGRKAEAEKERAAFIRLTSHP